MYAIIEPIVFARPFCPRHPSHSIPSLKPHVLLVAVISSEYRTEITALQVMRVRLHLLSKSNLNSKLAFHDDHSIQLNTSIASYISLWIYPITSSITACVISRLCFVAYDLRSVHDPPLVLILIYPCF